MVAIVAGQGLGVTNTSLGLLGGVGQLGGAAHGPAGEKLVVNARTGNLVIQQQDEWLVGVGPDVGISRSYNSLATGTDDNGDNWQLGLSRRITGISIPVNQAGAYLHRVGEDGAQIRYNWDAGRGLYVSTAGGGSFDTLRFEWGVGEWIWRDGDTRLQECYEITDWETGDARLRQITDVDGKSVTIGYHATLGVISTVTMANGDRIELTYQSGSTSGGVSKAKNLSKMETWSAAGLLEKSVSYDYDDYNRLTVVTLSTVSTGTFKTIYSYADSSSRRVNQIRYTNGSGVNGSTVSIQYDGASGRVNSILDGESRLLASMDYTVAGRTRLTDAVGLVTDLMYEVSDAANLDQLRRIKTYASGGEISEQSFDYDALGNVQRVVNAGGLETQYQYDGNGNRVYERDSLGRVVRRYYDSTNRLITQTQYSDLDPDLDGTMEPLTAQTSRYVYDTVVGKTHQLRYMISPEGRVTGYVYNSLGQLQRSIQYAVGTLYTVSGLAVNEAPTLAQLDSWAGAQVKTGYQISDYAYDLRGQLDRQTTYATIDATTGNGVADGSQSVTQYVYDHAGNLLQQIDGRGYEVASLDTAWAREQRRLLSVVYPSGHAQQGQGKLAADLSDADKTLIRQQAHYSTNYQYDGINRVVLVTDPLGQVTSTTFKDDTNQTAVTLANGLVRTSTFDKSGRLLTLKETTANLGFVYGTTSYAYDAAGRLKSVTLPNGQASYLIHDQLGRNVGEVDAEGALTEYRYNDLGQKVRTIRYGQKLSSSMLAALVAGTAGLPNNLQPPLVSWSFTKVNASATGISSGQSSGSESEGTLLGERTGTITQSANATPTESRLTVTTSVKVTVGQRYEVSSYVGVTNATAQLKVEYFDATGASLGLSSVLVSGGGKAGGPLLADYLKLQAFVTIPSTPANIASIKVVVVKTSASNTAQASRLWVTHPLVAESSDSQNKPSLADLRPAVNIGLSTRQSVFVYDQSGRLRMEVAGAIKTGISGLFGEVKEYRYDGAGRLLGTIQYATLLTSAEFSKLTATGSEPVAQDGQIVTKSGVINLQVDAANDRSTHNIYDKDGLLRVQIDGENYIQQYLYDNAGRMQRMHRYAKPASIGYVSGQTAQEFINSNLVASAYDYDVEGSDQATTYIYNARGQLRAKLDPMGFVHAYVYDAAGNTIKETHYTSTYQTWSAGGAVYLGPQSGLPGRSYYVVPHANDHVSVYEYDAHKRVIRSELQPQGLVTTYEYDKQTGLLIKSTAGVGSEAGERTEQRRYDQQGRMTHEMGGEGSKALAALSPTATQDDKDAIWKQYATRYFYNESGYRTATLTPNGVDGVGNRTMYYYDTNGRMTHSVNALGEVLTYTYNVFGDLTQERRLRNRVAVQSWWDSGLVFDDSWEMYEINAATSTDDRTTDYYYGRDGRLSRKVDAEGAETLYRYTAFGEQSWVAKTHGNDSTLTTEYLYDRRGYVRYTAELDQNEERLRQQETRYDAFGRMSYAVDAKGHESYRSYDRLGRLIAIWQPDGLYLGSTMSYDAFGRVLQAWDASNQLTTYVYDDAARTMTVTTPEGVSTVTHHDVHGQVVEVADGRAHVTRYTYNKDGQLTDSAVYASGGNVALSGTTTHTDYDKAGRVFKHQDGRGNVTRTVYDAANRVLTRIQDDNNLKLTTEYRYDGHGNVIWSRDAQGTWTSSEYDREGLLTAVTVDPSQIPDATGALISNPKGADALALRTEFQYQLDDSLHRVIKGAGSSRPETTEYRYDSLGRRTNEVVDPDGLALETKYHYDLNDNVVAREDALGNVTRYVYDASNLLVYTVDATGAVVRTDHDANGRVSRTTAYAQRIDLQGLGMGVLATDIMTRLPQSIQDNDQISYRFYDGDGRLSYTVDALGYVIYREYDDSNNLARVTRYHNAASQLDQTGTEVDGRWTFDFPVVAADPATAERSSRDRVEQYVYDAANRQIWKVDALGYATKTTYGNLFDLYLQSTTQYHNAVSYPQGQTVLNINTEPTVVADAERDRVTVKYSDALGRELWVQDAEQNLIGRTFDETGRIETETHYTRAASLLGGEWDPDNVVTRYGYDAAGRLTQVTNAENVVTLHRYDDAGRLTDTTQAFGTDDASTVHYEYDHAGRLIQESRAYQTSAESITRYILNDLGQREWIISPRGVELAEGDSEWAVAERQKLGINTAPASGSVQHAMLMVRYGTQQQYDKLGRVERIQDPMGGVTLTEYDAFGNAIKVTDPRGNSGYFYFNARNESVFQIDPLGYGVESVRDGFGDVKEIKRYFSALIGEARVDAPPIVVDLAPTEAPIGGAFVRTSPELNEVGFSSGGDSITYIDHDKLGRQIRITDAEGVSESMTYDGLGNKVSVTNKLGGQTLLDYDLMGNLVEETFHEKVRQMDQEGSLNRVASGDLAQYQVKNVYEYDAFGNRTKSYEAYELAEQRDTEYKYDKLGRLKSTIRASTTVYTVENGEQSGRPTENRVFDARGNLIETNDLSGHRVLTWWDALDRKVAELRATQKNADDTLSGTLTTFTYDVAGNLVTQCVWGVPVQLPATPGGSAPTRPVTTDVREIHFVYDANNRVVQRVNGEVMIGEISPVDGKYELQTKKLILENEYDANGNLTREVDARGQSTYHYYDANGNRVVTVNADRYATYWLYDGAGQAWLEFKGGAKIDSDFDLRVDSLVDDILAYSSNALDRITFMYRDRMGRMVAKAIKMVPNYELMNSDAEYFSNLSNPTFQVTVYEYNGLGSMTKQSVLTQNSSGTLSETSEWVYDKQGRLIRQKGASFTDMDGVVVNERTDVEYNGLGLTAREIRRGKLDGTLERPIESDDRITYYRYDANGWLSAKIDPAGSVTQYQYDLGGRMTQKSVARHEGTDAINRAVTKRPGQLYLERVVQPAGGTVTYQSDIVSLGAWQSGTLLKSEIALGSNGVDRSFVIGLESTTSQKYLRAEFSGNLVVAGFKGFEPTPLVAGTSTGNGRGQLAKGLSYVLEVRSNIVAGQAVLTLYVYEKGKEYNSGFIYAAPGVIAPWMNLKATILNKSAPALESSAGVGVTDTVDYLILSNAMGITRTEDFGDWHDSSSKITFQNGAKSNILVIDAKGESARSLSDVETYQYDLQGREVLRETYGLDAGSSLKKDASTMEVSYNSYGDVKSKGKDGVSSERAEFDAVGRIVRSLGADGVPRIHLYDANGNVTMTLRPPADGASSSSVQQIFNGTSTLTAGDIKTLLENAGAQVEGFSYDNRNNLTDTIEASSGKLFVGSSKFSVTKGSVVPEELKTYPTSSSMTTGKGVAVSYKYDSKITSDWTGGGAGNDRTIRTIDDKLEVSVTPSGAGQKYAVVLAVDKSHIHHWHPEYYVKEEEQTFYLTDADLKDGRLTRAIDFTREPIQNYWTDVPGVSGARFTLKVYRVTDNQLPTAGELVTSMSGELPGLNLPPSFFRSRVVRKPGEDYFTYLKRSWRSMLVTTRVTSADISASGAYDATNTRSLTISSLPEGASRVLLQYRTANTQPAAWQVAHAAVSNGKVIFTEDLLRALGSSVVTTAAGTLQLNLHAIAADGRLLSVQYGEVSVYRDSAATPAYFYGDVTKAFEAVQDRTARVFSTSAGINLVMASQTNAANPPVLAQSAIVRWRLVGNAGWGSPVTINAAQPGGQSTPGWFVLPAPGSFVNGQKWEYMVELRSGSNGSGGTLDKLTGSVTSQSGTTALGTAYQIYTGADPVKADRSPTLMRLFNVPDGTATVWVTYNVSKRAASMQLLSTNTLEVFKNAQGIYEWDAAVVGFDPDLQYLVDYTFTSKSSTGTVLGTVVGREVIRTGLPVAAFKASIYSPSSSPTQYFRPTTSTLEFNVTDDEQNTFAKAVRKLVVYYRAAGSSGAYSSTSKSFLADGNGLVKDISIDFGSILPVGVDFADYDMYYHFENQSGGVILQGGASYQEDPIAPVAAMPVLVRIYRTNATTGSVSDAAAASMWGFKDSPYTSRYTLQYNAFGEVELELDATNGWELRQRQMAEAVTTREAIAYHTQYLYDGAGRLQAKISPETSATMANGFKMRGRPTEMYDYDAFGRLIKYTDANGYSTSYSLRATGDSRRLVSTDFDHIDRLLKNGELYDYYAITDYSYDVFGDLRRKSSSRDGVYKRVSDGARVNTVDNAVTDYSYNNMGQLVREDRPLSKNGLRATHLYSYDSKGQRVLHRTSPTSAIDTNGGLGVDQIAEYTLFDAQGRVKKYISGEKLENSVEQGYDSAAGYWYRFLTDENGLITKDWFDYSGRVVRHIDLGGNEFRYVYNFSGNLVQQYQSNNLGVQLVGKQDITYSYWADGTLKKIDDKTLNVQSYFEYDQEGRRVYEAITQSGQEVQKVRISYDELGRMVSAQYSPYFWLDYEYDPSGNRRRVHSRKLDGSAAQTVLNEVDYWYEYDGQGKMLVSMGTIEGGPATTYGDQRSITGGSSGSGVTLGYDALGNRTFAEYAGKGSYEYYVYGLDGMLNLSASMDYSTGDTLWYAIRDSDLLGRVVTYRETKGSVARQSDYVYDDNNRVAYVRKSDNKTDGSTVETWNSYHRTIATGNAQTETGELGGLLKYSTTVSTPKDGTAATRTTMGYTYELRDTALQKEIKVVNDNATVTQNIDTWGKWASGVSHFEYDVNGHIKLVKDSRDGTNTNVRTINYVTDANGVVLNRTETTGGSSILPFQRYFYLDGRRVAEWGNDNPAAQMNYTDAMMEPEEAPEPVAPVFQPEGGMLEEAMNFTLNKLQQGESPLLAERQKGRYRNVGPIRSNVDQNYQPINGSYPAFTADGYVVRAGDTLSSIAQAVWGDSTLWYLIADANGLMAATASLTQGQTLIIPNKVTNVHNTSQTRRVYDAGEALGDVSPTIPDAPTPPPPNYEEGCGFIGQLLMIVVSVVATVITAGLLAPAAAAGTSLFSAGLAALQGGGVLVGMAAGAAGSIAGQLVGLATGVIDEFSWTGVAMGAIGGGVGAGVGKWVGNVVGDLGNVGNAIARAAAGNAITQGVAVATGLQKRFDWRAVAASAVSGAVGYGMSDALSGVGGADQAAELMRRTATGMVSSAAYSAVMGQRIDWASNAVNSFGSALGDSIVGSIQQADSKRLTDAQIDKYLDGVSGSGNPYMAPESGMDRQRNDGRVVRDFDPNNEWDSENAGGGGYGDNVDGLQLAANGKATRMIRMPDGRPMTAAQAWESLKGVGNSLIHTAEEGMKAIATGMASDPQLAIASAVSPSSAETQRTLLDGANDFSLPRFGYDLGDPSGPAMEFVTDTIQTGLAINGLVRGGLSIGGLLKTELSSLSLSKIFSQSVSPSEAKLLLNGADGLKVDLFGGAKSQLPSAINVDIDASIGVRADITHGLGFIPDGSVKQLTAFNPFVPERGGMFSSDVFGEASRVLSQGGEMVVAATKGNSYVKLNKLPSVADFEKMGFEVVNYKTPLTQIDNYASKFGSVKFSQSGGAGYINPNDMTALVLRKKQ